jgi:hypothetical protein
VYSPSTSYFIFKLAFYYSGSGLEAAFLLGLDYCGWEMFLGLDRSWAHRKKHRRAVGKASQHGAGSKARSRDPVSFLKKMPLTALERRKNSLIYVTAFTSVLKYFVIN